MKKIGIIVAAIAAAAHPPPSFDGGFFWVCMVAILGRIVYNARHELPLSKLAGGC